MGLVCPGMHPLVPASAHAEPTGGTDLIRIQCCCPGSVIGAHDRKFWLAL